MLGQNVKIIFLFLSIFFTSLIYIKAEEFPYRKEYPDVPVISTAELMKKHESRDVLIIDVRSKIEFNVIHPIDAVHLPIAHMLFISKLKELITQYPDRDIVFYCNGINCLKSYEAVQKSISAGIKNSFAYDAGIPEWVRLNPEKTLLLGNIVKDAQKQIIQKSDFLKHCLSFKDFKAKAEQASAVVVDVRDHIQYSGKLHGLKKVRLIPMDKFITNYVEKKINQNMVILIFDQVGKQIRWIQYYLIQNGYKKYFFLKGGATDVLRKQIYK